MLTNKLITNNELSYPFSSIYRKNLQQANEIIANSKIVLNLKCPKGVVLLSSEVVKHILDFEK